MLNHLSQHQIQLLEKNNIRTLFTELDYLKSNSRYSRRINRKYGLTPTSVRFFSTTILTLSWLIMQECPYRNLRGHKPADLITRHLTANYNHKEFIIDTKYFYSMIPKLLKSDQLDQLISCIYNIILTYKNFMIIRFSRSSTPTTTGLIDAIEKEDERFLIYWLLERLKMIKKNKKSEDYYKFFEVWSKVHDFF